MRLPALVAVVASIAVLGVVSNLVRGDEGTDKGAADPAGVPQSGATSTSQPASTTVSPRQTVPGTSPTSTTQPPVLEVDVGALPELEASHLAIGSRGRIQFLDLNSGIWTAAELSSDVYEMYPVSGGVVFTKPSGAIGYATVDGDDPVSVSDGWLIGVSGQLIIVNHIDPVIEDEPIQALRVDGSVAWSLELPGTAWPAGVSTDGRIFFQANEQLAAIDPATGSADTLGTGSILGTIDNLALIKTCTEQLDCGIDQLDATTGERHRIINDEGWIRVVNRTSMLFTSTDSGQTTKYELIDGQLTATIIHVDPLDFEEPQSAIDKSGATVELHDDQIRFFDATGELLAELPEPFGDIRGGALLALIVTAD